MALLALGYAHPVQHTAPGFPASGFAYQPGFISARRKRSGALCRKTAAAVTLKTFTFQGYKAQRRTASFGYDYSFEKGIYQRYTHTGGVQLAHR